MALWNRLLSSILLYCLVLGMSATVELKQMKKQLHNWRALLCGVSLQFCILPFLGFLVTKLLSLSATTGIMLLVVTSSPGGSYSNWWCSLFNAELALSVTMTALSTLLSTVLLPCNLLLYTRWTYSDSVVQSLDWSALAESLVVVLGGISSGLYLGHRAAQRGERQKFHKKANLLGNVAGVSLIALSLGAVQANDDQPDVSLTGREWTFYVAVILPALLGIIIATQLTTLARLPKPERVAVAIEGCYQNTGIATSVALNMFTGAELATAIGVPLLYGIVEALMLAVYGVFSWKRGWTKAPPDENVCRMILHNYQDDDENEEGGDHVLIEGQVGVEVVGRQDVVGAENGAVSVTRMDTTPKRPRIPSADDPTEVSDGGDVLHDAALPSSNETETNASASSPFTSRWNRTVATVRANVNARRVGYRQAPARAGWFRTRPVPSAEQDGGAAVDASTSHSVV